MMVALTACFAASTDAAGTLAGISGVEGSLTLALSFYALMMFFTQLTAELVLIRPAVVRFWHAVVLVCVTAAVTWISYCPT